MSDTRHPVHHRPVETRDLRLAVLVVLALAVGCSVFAGMSRGIWLDEFWSLRLGALDQPFRTIVEQRWLSDTHPPLANLLYRLVSLVGVDPIEWRRVALNLPALLMLGAGTLHFTRISAGRSAFPAVLFVLALALSGTIDALSDYRSYAWQITAFCIALNYVRLLFMDEARVARGTHIIGAVAMIGAIALHYIAGIIACITIGLAILVHLRAKRWRTVAMLMGPALVGGAAVLVSGLILVGRMRRDIDVGWIVTTPATGAMLFLFLLVIALAANPLASWFAIRDRMIASERAFASVLVVSIAVAAIALIALNLATPILIERYLITWQLLICALIALASERQITASRAPFVAFIAIGVLMVVIGTANAARHGGWRAGRDLIAAQVRRCPETRVYAMSSWRLKTVRASNAARRETEVIDTAYRELGRQGGFDVTTLDLLTPAVLKVGTTCPTILWVEHLGWDDVRDIAYLQRAGRLAFDRPVHIEIRPTESGFVTVARAQKR